VSTVLEQLLQLEIATKERLVAIYKELADLRAMRGSAQTQATTSRIALLKERRTALDKENSKISKLREYLCRHKNEGQSIWAISDSLTGLQELRAFYMEFDTS
jgi:phosphoserine phosphatase